MKGLKWRVVTLCLSVAFAVYLLLPSYIRYKTGNNVPKTPKPTDPWYYHVIPSETLKLGLDLVGGLHLVLGIDFEEVRRDAVTKLKNDLKEMGSRDGVTGFEAEVVAGNKIRVTYPDSGTWKKVEGLLAKHFNQTLDLESETPTTAILKMTADWESQIKSRAMDQSLETLRNRIDEFGIAEPTLQRQGDERIMIQFPGVQEPGRLKEIIARTAKLSFQIVKTGPEVPGDSPNEDQLRSWIAEFEKKTGQRPDPQQPISKYLRELNTYLGDKLPKGSEVLFKKVLDVNTREARYEPYLLEKEALVTGEDLQDAYYSFDPQDNHPVVLFQLTPIGATKFEKATKENVGRHMAIVLDNNVHSAPVIKEKIGGGQARIDLGGSERNPEEVQKDAKDTALVLRSGALPARLEFLEERVVGPSLGNDAIRAGTLSLVLGLTLVFLFMVIYYRGSGLIADLALFLNGLLIVAAMAAFEGTLTLPGLAGITLTLGMAVDANVLIFEHIREELRNGRSLGMALAEGYSRAFSAILDSHATSIVAGLILLSFGYGPIRGFAVTLLIGLVASLFTSVFVTRIVFDYIVVVRKRETISI